MYAQKQGQRILGFYREFPSQYWVLVLGTFIDVLGGAVLFPFFSLYITRKFGVGMTEVGLVFGIFSIASVVGSMIGGAMTDRFGRKGMVLFGLIASALTSLLLGLVNEIEYFYVVTGFVGLFANAGGPARQAMVVDLLPEAQRAQGFGIIRVVMNLGVTIGPLVGGLLINQSFLLIFICDAVSSIITAVVVYFALHESRPETSSDQPEQSIFQTFAGYLDVLRDGTFTWFLMAMSLMTLVYVQMNSTLAVFLRDNHNVSEQSFSYILSLNAGMVVLFQFPIMRWIGRFRSLMVIVVGTLLYAVGFSMYGFVNSYLLFLLAMVIITIGEMFVSPVSQAVIAQLAPEEMRGRYMAVSGFSWVIPFALGPLLAGLIMDNGDPNWVWYAAGIVGLAAAGAFLLLEQWIGRSTWAAVHARLDVLEMLENQEITAAEAAHQINAVKEGSWALLVKNQTNNREKRHLHIKVNDPMSNTMKTDLRLPMALVNVVLDMGGTLADELYNFDLRKLEAIIAKGGEPKSNQLEKDGDDQVEITLE